MNSADGGIGAEVGAPAGQPVLVIADDLIGRPLIEIGQARAMQGNLIKLIGKGAAGMTGLDPLQSLLERQPSPLP